MPKGAIFKKRSAKKVLFKSFVMMQFFFSLINFFSLQKSTIFVLTLSVPCFMNY